MRTGYRINLNGEDIINSLPRKTRNTIRRSSNEIYVRLGTLAELNKLHFQPTYLPKRLQNNQKIFVAVIEDNIDPISAVLIELKEKHIVYRFSGNDKKYLNYNANTYLLWWIAELYNNTEYKYIDLGGSKIKSIDDFKRRISNETYPLKEKPRLLRIYLKLKYKVKQLGF